MWYKLLTMYLVKTLIVRLSHVRFHIFCNSHPCDNLFRLLDGQVWWLRDVRLFHFIHWCISTQSLSLAITWNNKMQISYWNHGYKNKQTRGLKKADERLNELTHSMFINWRDNSSLCSSNQKEYMNSLQRNLLMLIAYDLGAPDKTAISRGNHLVHVNPKCLSRTDKPTSITKQVYIST